MSSDKPKGRDPFSFTLNPTHAHVFRGASLNASLLDSDSEVEPPPPPYPNFSTSSPKTHSLSKHGNTNPVNYSQTRNRKKIITKSDSHTGVRLEITSADRPNRNRSRTLTGNTITSRNHSKSSPAIFTPTIVPVLLVPRPVRPSNSRRTSSSSSIASAFCSRLTDHSQYYQAGCSDIPYSRPTPAIRATRDMHPDSGDDLSTDDHNEDFTTSWLERKQHLQQSKRTPSFREKLFSLASASNVRTRGSREKLISTKPGTRGAGETETEADEPPRHLPTTRNIPSNGSSRHFIPPNILQQRLMPFLFEFSRLLSIVPALFAVVYLSYHIYDPPSPGDMTDGRRPPERIDYLVSLLWALLTGYQCLSLTTGLLVRWRVYYPPLATLIRLISLQAICWPATHFTLRLLGHENRPVIVWAVIGTTTCASRSVQIWVTSNLWWETPPPAPPASSTPAPANGGTGMGGVAGGMNLGPGAAAGAGGGGAWQHWTGGRWGGRRWDWNGVVRKCMIPAGVLYCVMAWAEQLRREWSGC